jgi:alpha-tubulin suppressor-like RCC1 family protein
MRRRIGVALGVVIVTAFACGLDETVLRDAPRVADAGVDARPMFEAAVPSDVYGIFTGQYFSCALTGGVGSCWGSDVHGQIGAGDLSVHLAPVPIAQLSAFSALALGENHACAVEDLTGRVFCWGSNKVSQLGMPGGDRNQPEIVTLGPAKSVTAGYEHACAVLHDGSLWCWGSNAEGQLGQSDQPGAPDSAVPLRVGTGNDWTAVSGGQGHTCGLRTPGTLWCWGRNSASELGLGDGQPVQVRTPTQLGTFSDWASMDVGQGAGCGVRAGGELWCWGDGSMHQLGPGPGGTTTLVRPTRIGTDADWAVVSTDVFSTCAVKTSHALYCWGRNAEGQLGTGDTDERTTPTLVSPGDAFSSVAVGRFHACAEGMGRELYCTGENADGQLGLGDTDRRGIFTRVGP